jgi:mRNA interferase HigB
MRVIAMKAIKRYAEHTPQAATSLLSWANLVSAARWANFVELRAKFPSADQVGRRTVFNIGGNKFRLIARVNYASQRVYILHILAHKEYDTDAWKS